MIDVQNRTPLPGKEGRVTFALDGGTTLGGILSMVDEATQEGTPWDRDTARKLQADIRTYPVAAGQSITAGDVVDVVGGNVQRTVGANSNAETVFSGGHAAKNTKVCQLTPEICIFLYSYNGNNDYKIVEARVAITSSDGVIKNLATECQIISDLTVGTDIAVTRLSDTQFVVGYMVSTLVYAVVATVSGTSISLGSTYLLAYATSTTEYLDFIFLSAGRVLLVHGSTTVRAQFCSVSGTVISPMNEVTLAGTTSVSYISATLLPDDSSGNKRVCVCFSDGGDGSKGKAVIATISSANVVTWGTIITIYNSACSSTQCAMTKDYIFAEFNGSNLYILDDKLNIVANETIKIGGGGDSYESLVSDKVDNSAVYICLATSSPLAAGARVIRYDQTTGIALGELYSFNGSALALNVSASAVSHGKFIIAYSDAANSNLGTATCLEVLNNQIAGSFTDLSKGAIALTTATAGQNCEVIYSGVASLPGITEGQKITSDGVYGAGVLDGVLQVWSKDRPGQVVTGSFTTSAQLTTIDLGFTPMAVIIYGQENNGRIAASETTTANIAQIPKVLTSWYKDSTFGKIVQNGFSHWTEYGNQGQTFFYIALQGR